MRAATHAAGVEEEAREIANADTCKKSARTCDLAESIRRDVAPLGGVDLEPPARDARR